MGDGCNLVEWWNRETRFAIVALDGFLVVAVLVYHSYSLFIFCSLVGAVHCQSMVGFARDVRFPAIFYLRDNIHTNLL